MKESQPEIGQVWVQGRFLLGGIGSGQTSVVTVTRSDDTKDNDEEGNREGSNEERNGLNN